MQVLATIEWLAKEFEPVLNLILPVVRNHDSEDMNARLQSISGILFVQFGRCSERIGRNPDAFKVLEAFGLDYILDPQELTSRLYMQGKDNRGGSFSNLWKLYTDWREMVATVAPFRALTSPHTEIKQNEGTLDINVADRETLTLKSVIEILSDIQSLYETTARLSGDTEYEPLEVIKIETGTSLSLNVKGLGEPIKEIKKFVLEMWTKHRHKRADEIVDHNRAVASSLQLIVDIEKKVKRGELTNEDGNRLTRAVVQKTLSLFKNSALISEIPSIETVDNNKLLVEGFGTKLLPAPEVHATTEKPCETPLSAQASKSEPPRATAPRPIRKRSNGTRTRKTDEN
jgi:hypothetical protein